VGSDVRLGAEHAAASGQPAVPTSPGRHGAPRPRPTRELTLPAAEEASQSWDASHQSDDSGRKDGFVRASGPVAMRLWDERDLPFTYSLAKHFPIGERFFASTLAQTYPNRRFFFTGTASGTISTNSETFSIPAANGTIWDRLDAHQIDWAIYYQNLPSWLIVPGSFTVARAARQRKFPQFLTDVAAGKLPQFTFLDPDYNTTSEENPQEQVPPPRAIKPDSIAPVLAPGDVPGRMTGTASGCPYSSSHRGPNPATHRA
jgi:phospholipase C